MTTTTRPKRARRFARAPMTTAPAVALAATVLVESNSTRALALLQRPDGATLDELIAATGWLPHTTRAAMTGLRKKGYAIQRTVIDSVSHYAITGRA